MRRLSKPGTCGFAECDRPLYCKELCIGHYLQNFYGKPLRPLKKMREYGKTCTVSGCEQPHRAKGLCNGHYRQRALGKALAPLGYLPPSQIELLADCAHVILRSMRLGLAASDAADTRSDHELQAELDRLRSAIDEATDMEAWDARELLVEQAVEVSGRLKRRNYGPRDLRIR